MTIKKRFLWLSVLAIVLLVVQVSATVEAAGGFKIEIEAPMCSKKNLFSTRMPPESREMFCMLYTEFYNESSSISSKIIQQKGCTIDFKAMCGAESGERVKTSKIISKIERIDKNLTLPHDKSITFKIYCATELCDGKGVGPFCSDNIININIEDAASDFVQFQKWFSDEPPEDIEKKLTAHVESGLLHELGHGFFDVGDAGSLGWEEDAADTFSMLMGLTLSEGLEGYDSKTVELMEAAHITSRMPSQTIM